MPRRPATLSRFGRYALLAACALVGSQAWAGAGWTGFGAVLALNPTTKGRFEVKVDLEENPSGCREKQWFYRDYTGTGSDHMFRAFLGAVTAGKRVRVYVTGRCDIEGYSEITEVTLVP